MSNDWLIHVSGSPGNSADHKITVFQTVRDRQVELNIVSPGALNADDNAILKEIRRALIGIWQGVEAEIEVRRYPST